MHNDRPPLLVYAAPDTDRARTGERGLWRLAAAPFYVAAAALRTAWSARKEAI